MDINALQLPELLTDELAPDTMRHIRGLLNALYHAKSENGLNYAREELQKMAVRFSFPNY